MKLSKAIALSSLLVTSLSACAEQTQITRANTAEFSQSSLSEHAALQAQSLQKLADDMVRRSTGRGAVAGAAFGCSLALVSASKAQRCLAGAAVGAAAGGMIGHAAAKQKIKQTIAKVSADEMAIALRETSGKLTEIKQSLPEILAQQDRQLAALDRAKAAGKIPHAEYASRVRQIQEDRTDLAQALTDSATKANATAQNLGLAASQGQSGLMWHITRAMELEAEATSARAQIALF